MTLHLLPNLLNNHATLFQSFPQEVIDVVGELDGLIAETPTMGRRFLKKFRTKFPPDQIPIVSMDEDVSFILEPLMENEQWGLVSDCGLPCIADPGAKIVQEAFARQLVVKAYPGPSSILLALMLSGLPGQHFCFHGYIAKDPKKRGQEIREWEKASIKRAETQIFIEAPHRTPFTFQHLLKDLEPQTMLSVSQDLMGPNAFVKTQTIEKWNQVSINIEKKPTVFLFNKLDFKR